MKLTAVFQKVPEDYIGFVEELGCRPAGHEIFRFLD